MRRAFEGWDLGAAYAVMAEAQRVWDRYGIRIDVPGDIDLQTAPTADVAGGSYARDRLARAGVRQPYGAKIPVVFARSVFELGAEQLGGATYTSTTWREDAVIALSNEGATDTTLAHEIGHALGLTTDVNDRLRLMHRTGDRLDTNLTQDEFWQARSFYRRRVGGR
jgi:hypothetical protein